MSIKFVFTILAYFLLLIVWFRVFVISSYYSFRRFYKIRKCGVTVRGRITDVIMSKSSDDLPLFKPVIKYTTIENQQLEFSPEHASSVRPRIGEPVDIKYMEENPGEVILNSKRKLIFEIFLLLFVVGILLLFSCNFFFYILSRGQPSII